MKLLALIALLMLYPVLATGQARTAERIVSVTHAQLNVDNPANGSVRHVINGTEGTTPCTSGGSGAIAYKINGVWSCPRLTPGVGSGDVTGPAASSIGEVVVYNTTGGKSTGRSNTLSGVAFMSNGVLTALASTGTGGVVRDNSATLTSPTLLTPTISTFAASTHNHEDLDGGGQLNASAVFNAGTVPPDRIITGAITNSRCLRVSNVGQIEVAAADCGAGGGGSPGGVSGNLLFNEAGAFGGASNSSYNAVTGQLTVSQKANGNDTLTLQRATDSGPTGNLLRARNAANSTDLFRLEVDGTVALSNTVVSANIVAPATPAANVTVVWTDATTKNLKAQDDAGNVSGTVRPITCSGTDKISGISSAGVPVCTADQGGSGTGVITLNTLNTSDQTFAVVDDTNVDLDIASSVSTHTFTMSWVGRLDAARQDINTVHDDTANTWTTGIQSFAAATSLVLPTAAGIAPTVSGSIAYDTTSNSLEYGENGTNRTVVSTDGAQALANKTLANSNTANLRDTLLTLQDNTDSTKTANFELSGITSGTNRVVTVANANSVTVIPTTATTNQWVKNIGSDGVQIKTQPSFADISGSMGATQGGTGQTSVAQGDLLFGDATNSWARLPKSTTATRVLTNTGSSNNPAWAQVDLTNAVTGVLPPANWSPLTTKGDLLVHNGTTSVRQGIGTNGFALLADSAQTAGVRWGAITATAGGSSTQLQYNSAGALAGISGATTDGTTVTFSAGNIIIGSQSAAPTPTLGQLFVDSDDGKLYFGINGTTHGEVYVSGLSTVNLASANVTGVLPLANGGTNQSSWTASRCVQVNSAGTALEAAAAACGSGGGGTPGGSDTQVQFNDGGAFGGDAGLVYVKATDTLTIAGALALSATGAGYIELAEGSAPTVVANRLTFAAPADAPAAGLVYVLPPDTPTNGEQLTANISGTTVTLSWDAAGSGGSGDAVSVNGSAATDANFVATTASGTVPSITWALDTGATPDAVSIATIGAASATEAGVITTGAQTLAGKKTFSPAGADSGLNVGSIAGDPSAPANGDIWYDSTANELTARINGASVALGAGGGGGGTINAGATNTIPKYTASTTIDDSLLSDDATTLTYTGSGGLSLAPGTPATGVISLADTNQSHFLRITPGSNITADRTLTLTTGDADRTLTIGGAITTAHDLITSGAFSLTLTTTATTNVTLPTTGTLSTLAGSESLTNKKLGSLTTNGFVKTSSSDGTLSVDTATYETASSTATFTNKTIDTEATGNAFTSSHKVWMPAAGCSGSTAVSFWDLPASTPAAAACIGGTVVVKGVLDFADTAGGFSAQYTLRLPTDFTGTIDADIDWTTTATTGNVEWSLSTICTATNGTEIDDPGAFNTASTVVTAAPGVASRVQKSSITSVTITGCAADELLHLRIFRDGNDAQDTLAATARLIGVQLTVRRAQ